MNEMLCGNTGKVDGAVNINDSMPSSWYQKLQSRTFVPKIKSLLSASQSDDKNFVFIGEVRDKSERFSAFGYNARLQNDSRNGGFSHFIAFSASDKIEGIDLSQIKFLTEEGFTEYIYNNELNEDKRFVLTPEPFEIDINVKKRLVNNLMEAFMQMRKRKYVAFSFALGDEEDNIWNFSKKSTYIMMDIMQYLPYQMRKNISFISHLTTSKIPEILNLAAYPSQTADKPNDCINVETDAGALSSSDTFAAYVEKVFAMSEAERNAYFESLYNEIEIPSMNEGMEVKSDLYLLDTVTKPYWQSGSIEAIDSICNSVENVLNIYPAYKNIAVSAMQSNPDNLVTYIREKISEIDNVGKLAECYGKIRLLFDACGMDFSFAVPNFKEKVGEMLKKSQTGAELNVFIGNVELIDENIIDTACVGQWIAEYFNNTNSLNKVYDLYKLFKDSKFVDRGEFDILMQDYTDKTFENAISGIEDAKGKLDKVNAIFEEFEQNCNDIDHPLIKEVYARFKSKFSDDLEQAKKAEATEQLDNIAAKVRGNISIYDVAEAVRELAKVDVLASEDVKKRVENGLATVKEKLWEVLENKEVEELKNFVRYELKKFIDDVEMSVKSMADKGIIDGNELSVGFGNQKIYADSLYRFVKIFKELLEGLDPKEVQSLSDVLGAYEEYEKEIYSEEIKLTQMYKEIAPIVLATWMKKNPKLCTPGAFKKADKALNLKSSTKRLYEELAERYEYNKKGGLNIGLIAAIAGVVVVAAAIVLICLYLFGGNKDEKPQETPVNTQATEVVGEEETASPEPTEGNESGTEEGQGEENNTEPTPSASATAEPEGTDNMA